MQPVWSQLLTYILTLRNMHKYSQNTIQWKCELFIKHLMPSDNYISHCHFSLESIPDFTGHKDMIYNHLFLFKIFSAILEIKKQKHPLPLLLEISFQFCHRLRSYPSHVRRRYPRLHSSCCPHLQWLMSSAWSMSPATRWAPSPLPGRGHSPGSYKWSALTTSPTSKKWKEPSCKSETTATPTEGGKDIFLARSAKYSYPAPYDTQTGS